MRIMAVDEEPDILEIVEISLAKWGYVVDGFTDPVASLDHFRANALDYALILTDIRMPKCGAELARLRQKDQAGVKVMMRAQVHVELDKNVTLEKVHETLTQIRNSLIRDFKAEDPVVIPKPV